MKETRIDIFGDGIRIFLDYIARQFKKNPKYDPHPLIKAFELAVSGFKDVKNGERAMGKETLLRQESFHLIIHFLRVFVSSWPRFRAIVLRNPLFSIATSLAEPGRASAVLDPAPALFRSSALRDCLVTV